MEINSIKVYQEYYNDNNAKPPNGMARRQRRNWRDTLPIIAYSGKSRLRASGEAAARWSRFWALLPIR